MRDEKLNIVVWGINYWPEPIGIAPFNHGMCRFLRQQGHRVRMVCAFPYYPSWRKAPADRRRFFRTDTIDDIPVHRCWLHVPARATALRRMVHELSFGVASFLRILSLPRADLYLVVSPPLLLGPLAWVACLIKRSRYVFHVQDLQPDAALAMGMIRKGGTMDKALHATARLAYRKAGLVSGISRAMTDAFVAKGIPAERLCLFPNWVEMGGKASLHVSAPDRMRWRQRHRIPEDAFVASYSGNLGRKQGLDILIDAAKKSGRVFIVIAGDGAMRPILEARLRAQPMPNLRLLPLLSEEDYLTMLASSNICLITQARGTGKFFLPSKLLSILLAGRPVAATADDTSELARAVREGGFGVVVSPEDPGALAAALSNLAGRAAELDRFGERGSRWVAQFESGRVLGRFEQRLRRIVAGGPALSLQPN